MIVKDKVKTFNDSTSNIDISQNDHIERLRNRYQDGPAYISIERAKYYTECWRETEDKSIPIPIRVALSMKNYTFIYPVNHYLFSIYFFDRIYRMNKIVYFRFQIYFDILYNLDYNNLNSTIRW